MSIAELIESLEDAGAYPHPAHDARTHQTHISVVFLAGRWAYKVKKPVDLGFLDFRSLERRRHFCDEEVRLNRRRAPGVYHGVVPVTRGRWARDGSELAEEDLPEGGPPPLRFGGSGDPVEWAVRMERLPPEATLLSRLERDELAGRTLVMVGERVAGFHAEAESGEHVSRLADFEVVARNARENLAETRDQVGPIVRAPVHRRLEGLLERRLEELEPLIRSRAREGRPRDTHGDLHLDHLYWFPDREPPRDLIAVDCIEFEERFRYADPVADMAFLSMDLRYRGRPELDREFVDAYFRASGDGEGRPLLPFYRSYRSAVRAKVEGILASEDEVSREARAAAGARAEAHWLLALSELEAPGERPAMVLVGGLPGTGKSTLAAALARDARLTVIATDRVRKELAGLPPTGPSAGEGTRAPFEEGIYTPAWTERTYRTCLERACDQVRSGGRVLVDGSFRHEAWRTRFLDAGVRLGVTSLLLECRADEAVVRARLRRRLEARKSNGAGGEEGHRPQGGGEGSRSGTGDASDADLAIHREVRSRWEEPSPATRRRTFSVSGGESADRALAEARAHLQEAGLAEARPELPPTPE